MLDLREQFISKVRGRRVWPMLGRQSCLGLKIILLLLYGVVQTEGALGVEGTRQGEVDVEVAGLSHGEG